MKGDGTPEGKSKDKVATKRPTKVSDALVPSASWDRDVLLFDTRDSLLTFA